MTPSLQETAVPNPWFALEGDSIRLLRNGKEAFPAMLECLAKAEREIVLEMYWIGDDPVGRRFRDVLAERAKSGVRVLCIYDSVGSMGISSRWFDPLLVNGGQVVEFHTISPLAKNFRIDRVEKRDHRKILVVDGELGFTGGINLAKEWLPKDEGGADWRDDMLQVRGGPAQELRAVFYRTWRRITRQHIPPDVVSLRERPSHPAWVLAGRQRFRRSIHREYVIRIDRSRSQIDLANSYFVPDWRVRRALFRAIRRGVRVRVLFPSASDVRIVQFASEALYDTLLRHGVELYRHDGMLHAKTAIIDDDFVTAGTYNLDERSFRKNLEVNLAVQDSAFAAHVRHWFEYDVAQATRLDSQTWRERGLVKKGLEVAAFAIRRLL